MQTTQNSPPHPKTRTYHYSLDWRFLLPMGSDARLLVLSEEGADFAETLEQVGMFGLDWHERLSSNLDARQERWGDLHALALPFGVATRRIGPRQEDHIEFYSACRRWICPGGYLLIGFENLWKFRPSAPSEYYRSTPGRVSYQLSRSGYTSIEIFGVSPNLNIPEYICHLQAQTLDLAFRQRFRRRAFLRYVLRWLLRKVGPAGISAMFPSYYAVAMA